MDRRLAAILYADAVGYSRLMGRHEDDAHRKLNTALDTLISEISNHRGKKIHEAGDAILAEFESITAAVNTAIVFQQTMASMNLVHPKDERLEFRVGVNLAEVIDDREDIYGDGVNLAARVQEVAEPGGVCVSGSVYEQVRGKVAPDFDDLGYRNLKNIADSVRVYRVHLSEMSTTTRSEPISTTLLRTPGLSRTLQRSHKHTSAKTRRFHSDKRPNTPVFLTPTGAGAMTTRSSRERRANRVCGRRRHSRL